MIRTKVLAEARDKVMGEREKEYGGPEDSFQIIANFWTVYLASRQKDMDAPIEPHDVALMMDLMKTARLCHTPDHADSWVDKAGYAACGGEITTEPSQCQHTEIHLPGGGPSGSSAKRPNDLRGTSLPPNLTPPLDLGGGIKQS